MCFECHFSVTGSLWKELGSQALNLIFWPNLFLSLKMKLSGCENEKKFMTSLQRLGQLVSLPLCVSVSNK